MSNLPPVEQFRALVKRLGSNQFLNRELQSICRLNALPTHGVKAELQKRIIEGMFGQEGWIILVFRQELPTQKLGICLLPL